jgi:hypothetical protein
MAMPYGRQNQLDYICLTVCIVHITLLGKVIHFSCNLLVYFISGMF